MTKVRPYQKKDFRFVQDICVATSRLANNPNPTNRAILCNMYCDYYLDYEPDYCFVAVDDNDEPVGYILCSVELDNYHEQLTENYLPLVRKISGSDYFRFAAEVKMEQRYIKQGYTAHLHIDVLPEFQGQGIGTELVNTLLAKLKENFVEGVYLVCGMNNEQAKEFYAKRGFEDIDYLQGCVIFGKKLYSEDE